MNLSRELNDSQLSAVTYTDGPQLVVAGAGSGKTRVLTYKIAYLLEQGLKPWSILSLTFTNKAAREMKERIVDLVGGDKSQGLQMGTFHSVFCRILRTESDALGLRSSFTIYDESDSKSMIKDVIKSMNLSDKAYPPSAVLKKISKAKNQLLTAQLYATNGNAYQMDERDGMPQVRDIYTIYQQRLRQAMAMDFDDILLYTFQLFEQNESIRMKYAQRFQYILVDEYQDTNFVQQRIICLLAKENQRLCVVGDDYQSIYAFRGAKIDNILNFSKDFPNAKTFLLERNYRSTQNIVAAANSLMKHNTNQIPKEVYSKKEDGDKIQYNQLYSDTEEAAYVCKNIIALRSNEDRDYSEFAILYRTNSQSRSFEAALRHMNIPYKIFGGMSFYQRKEIKDIIAYFRLIVNHDDEEAFKRVVNYPARGIGQTTINRLTRTAAEHNLSLWAVVEQIEVLDSGINKGAMSKLQSFAEMINGFAADIYSKNAYELGKDIIRKSGISAEIAKGNDEESRARQENVEEFVGSLSEFVENQQEIGEEEHCFLPDLLQEVALLSDVESQDESDSKVSLMTMHAAKGLEFKIVFVVGLEENIIPSMRSADSTRGIEEERRLLYVAITRAEEKCFLSSAKSRWQFGKTEYAIPSRFLADIDTKFVSGIEKTLRQGSKGKYQDEIEPPYMGFHGNDFRTRYGAFMQNARPVADRFMADPQPKITTPKQHDPPINPFGERTLRRLEQERTQYAGKRKLVRLDAAVERSNTDSSRRDSNKSSTSKAASGLVAGMKIRHSRFGIGTIVDLEGNGENSKVTVEFENAGTKQLLVKFANFTII